MSHITPASLWRDTDSRYLQRQEAKLITWSTIHVAPEGYEQFVPYIVAIVEFENESRLCVQLTDVVENDLSYGMTLRPVLRKMRKSAPEDVIVYGTKYTI